VRDWAARHWPALVAVAALWVAVGLIGAESALRNDGHLIYAFDDAYIHMAIARHWVERGVWGLTPYEFSSSSSSILWTPLLAGAFLLVGVRGSRSPSTSSLQPSRRW